MSEVNTLLMAALKEKVESVYHRYGASLKDDLQRERIPFILQRFEQEIASRPNLADELTGADAAQTHFVMQTLLGMVSEQARAVDTPVGKIVAYPKHTATDFQMDYPGVFIDLQRDGKDNLMLACVEYLPDGDIQCCVYSDGADDCPNPDPICYVNLDAE